jgi:hypothetical protein
MSPADAAALIERVKRVYVGYRTKWDVLYNSLLDDDQEALDFVRERLDPEKIRRQRAQAVQEKRQGRAKEHYEAQAIDLEEASYRSPAAVERAGRGRDVWLYHGTTTRFLRRILRDGLTSGVHHIDAKQPGVFLTARHGGWDQGGTAIWYAQRAAGHFGGEPIVLRVSVPFDWLVWDSDDEDIATGNWQFVADHVPPQRICEVNGEHIRGRCRD